MLLSPQASLLPVHSFNAESFEVCAAEEDPSSSLSAERELQAADPDSEICHYAAEILPYSPASQQHPKSK